MTAGAGRRQSHALRVLLVGPTNSPHVEDFARELKRRGIEVFVAGSPWAGGLGPSGLQAEGIPVLSPSGPSTLWLRRLVRELRPAIVHAHWLPYAVMARLAGARPLVATAWGSDVYLASRAQRLGYRWVLRRAEAVLADSHDLMARLWQLGAPESRTRIFSWGVDLSTFRPPSLPKEELRTQLGVGGGPIMLSARGFEEIYNPRVVVAAFELLAERRTDLQLVLKHNSARQPELPVLRYPNRVHVVGPQPRATLANWFGAASVCVSLASTDSSPRSVWEAMACGCPCVVSDLPWARGELHAGRDALLVPLAAEEVASAVGSVLDTPQRAQALAVAGRAHVQAHHDRDAAMQRTISLYRQLSPNGADR